jgi:hypothetical protein
MVVSVTLRPSAALRWVQRLDRSQVPRSSSAWAGILTFIRHRRQHFSACSLLRCHGPCDDSSSPASSTFSLSAATSGKLSSGRLVPAGSSSLRWNVSGNSTSSVCTDMSSCRSMSIFWSTSPSAALWRKPCSLSNREWHGSWRYVQKNPSGRRATMTSMFGASAS